MEKNLILIGGGGHCKSVIEVAESCGYNILGILDHPQELGKDILGYKVIGNDDDMALYVDKAQFIVTVGSIKDPSLRKHLHDRVRNVGGKLATIIASTAYVSKYATIGEGSVIMHFAMVNADAKIGTGCIINTHSNIEHDAIVGDYCHISTGAMVNGNCIVGNDVFLGSQSVMANGTSICDGCVIGAGSLVRKSFHIKGIYSGNPAILKIKAK